MVWNNFKARSEATSPLTRSRYTLTTTGLCSDGLVWDILFCVVSQCTRWLYIGVCLVMHGTKHTSSKYCQCSCCNKTWRWWKTTSSSFTSCFCAVIVGALIWPPPLRHPTHAIKKAVRRTKSRFCIHGKYALIFPAPHPIVVLWVGITWRARHDFYIMVDTLFAFNLPHEVLNISEA